MTIGKVWAAARLLLAFAGAAVPGATVSFARDYHIDSRVGAPEGDGTTSHPWQSLEALSKVEFQPGDNICFARGSRYEGGFELNESGTTNSPITIKAYGAGAAPRFTNPHSASLNGNAIRVNGSHVIIEDLFFERCPINPVSTDVRKLGAVLLTTNANWCIVRNCEMTQTPIGVTVHGEHNLITRNYIHDNNNLIKPHWGPVCVMICGSHNEISYNRFVNYCAPSREYGHDGGAIEIHDRAIPKEGMVIHHNLSLRNQGFIEWVGHNKQDNFLIHHNVCMDYQSFLGLTGPCTDFRVEHNTVVRVLAHKEPDSEDVIFWSYFGSTNVNFRNNIIVYDPARVEPPFARGELKHSYNLFYRLDHDHIPKQANPEAYERKYLGGGAQLSWGDRVGDPMFRNYRRQDFHLKAGSPAIGRGTNLQYTVDFDGVPIPTGKAPDIGAFQFVPER